MFWERERDWDWDSKPAHSWYCRVLDCASEDQSASSNCRNLSDSMLGDEVGRRGSPSHKAVVPRKVRSTINPINRIHTNCFHPLYHFCCCLTYQCSDLSPQVVPVDVPVIPLSCPTSPLLWFSITLHLDYFLHWKMQKTLHPSLLPTGSFCFSLFFPDSCNFPRLQLMDHPLAMFGCPLHQAP